MAGSVEDSAAGAERHILAGMHILTTLPKSKARKASAPSQFGLAQFPATFTISAAVDTASVIGVCTLGGVVMFSDIRRAVGKHIPLRGIELGALAEMRPRDGMPAERQH